ncbi:MAG: hypothetical protein E7510_08155 [Ruminococcus sp.]|nr:hypothetical protein [Ruminococcus sp.]
MNSKKSLSKKAFAAVAALTLSATSLVQPGLFSSKESTVKAATHDNYAKLLQQSLFLYDANMCGKKVDDTSLLTWRGNCHTSDEVDGGFHDAGDHAMFGLPQGFTASTLGWSYYEFKDAYDATGNTAHFKTISDYFNSFFKASTQLSGDTVSKFLYQKGDGDADHAYWGPPENQGGSRKMFWTSSGASDIAAEYAASLALSYLNFGNAEDLKYAEALYKFSTQHNQVATDGPNGFYKSSGCRDEQAWAAGWLYLATKNEKYKNDCASKQTQYLGWVHGWDNVDLGAASVYAHITGDWSKVNGWIGSKTGSNDYFFLDKWGSARLNASMQFTALVATKNSNADYGAWCQNQMDYLLGKNPANTCFVVGYASNSASKPHHRACSGTSNAEDNSPSKYVLVGALVGGPSDAGGTYQDSRADYVCNEVAVDYNAGLVGAAAGLYSIYKTGTVDSTIVGAKSNGVGGAVVNPPATTTVTTAPPQGNTTTSKTTTKAPSNTNPPSQSGDGYTLKVNKTYTYSDMGENDRMIGFAYEDFGLKASSKEKISKVEVKISANKNIGKWQGAFGTSTTVSPDYWTMSDEMSQTISGNSGTITWNVDADTADIIQYGYGGEIKFGVWWIDCDQFTIESVTLHTSGGSSSVVTTAKPVTTTKAPQTTNPPSSSSDGYTLKVNKSYTYSDLGEDERMIGFAYEDFGLKASSKEKISKVEVKISASGKIGKWEGAFGTSTTVSPDYWTMSKDMSQTISGNSGTITWNVDADTADIIQYGYGGEIKFGVWWIDCDKFTIDSVTLYTTGGSAVTTTKTTTTTKVTTTSKVTTTQKPSTSTVSGDINEDGVVSATDLASMMQSMVGKKNFTTQSKKNADLNNDGKISIVDLIKLKNLIMG